MNVEIKSCLEGVKEALGLAVMLDIFRGSNTIIAALDQGAEYIIPVSKVEEAYRLKKDNPGYFLFGEVNGLKPKGFDYGNSPVELSKSNVNGKVGVFRSSACSQGIVNLQKSEELWIGSYANATKIVERINEKKPKLVSLVAIGLDAYEKALEDELCAQYIKESVEGLKPDFEIMKKEILQSDGANRLRSLKQDRNTGTTFNDLDFCLRLDTYDIIPRVVKEKNLLTVRI